MSAVFSDSRSEPMPTLAQLMLLTQSELLALTVPESKRTQGVSQTLAEAREARGYGKYRQVIATCKNCGGQFQRDARMGFHSQSCSEYCRHNLRICHRSTTQTNRAMYDQMLELARADGAGWE